MAAQGPRPVALPPYLIQPEDPAIELEFLCVVCHELRDPNILTRTNCGHIFCMSCLGQYVTRLGAERDVPLPTLRFPCPYCRQMTSAFCGEQNALPPDAVLRLNATRVACPRYASQGCTWRGPLSEAFAHSCAADEARTHHVSCPECWRCYRAADLPAHEQLCSQRSMPPCPYCGEAVIHNRNGDPCPMETERRNIYSHKLREIAQTGDTWLQPPPIIVQLHYPWDLIFGMGLDYNQSIGVPVFHDNEQGFGLTLGFTPQGTLGLTSGPFIIWQYHAQPNTPFMTMRFRNVTLLWREQQERHRWSDWGTFQGPRRHYQGGPRWHSLEQHLTPATPYMTLEISFDEVAVGS